MRICCLIPARYDSSRLPGKPLLKINNKTVIRLTWEKCKDVTNIKNEDIYVVTDDDRIKSEIEKYNGNVIMITEYCLNGTERICKALEKLNKEYDVVVNVQGDEPFIKSENIDIAINRFVDTKKNNLVYNCVCSTLHYKITDENQLDDRGIGKLVLDKNNRILYCSRAMIPHTKTGKYDKEGIYNGHIGVFVFDRNYLNEYMKKNTMAQLVEDIEWLKIIEDGYNIVSSEVNESEIGINTPEDYKYLLDK